ncbi:MAG: hypothetical protein FD146_127 [Anaerolineaceae bacterium]|nr:MAG: hypothetical protein FD146_127 [Anaerolineaceae bacterium]
MKYSGEVRQSPSKLWSLPRRWNPARSFSHQFVLFAAKKTATRIKSGPTGMCKGYIKEGISEWELEKLEKVIG